MMPALVLDGLGRDGTPAGLNGRRSISFQALRRSIHHQKWIPLQRGLNIRPSSAAALSIAAYLLTDPSGRSLKGRGAGGPRLSTHHPSGRHPPPTPPPHPQLRFYFDRVQ